MRMGYDAVGRFFFGFFQFIRFVLYLFFHIGHNLFLDLCDLPIQVLIQMELIDNSTSMETDCPFLSLVMDPAEIPESRNKSVCVISLSISSFHSFL